MGTFLCPHKLCLTSRKLSWPKGCSVNDGVDKDVYLNSSFSLTFPTIDHLTDELVKIGRDAHIFKVDVRRAFRHLKVDPLYLDLLGLNWDGHYVDTCVLFGTRHGSQFFQRTSNAVRYVMCQHGHEVINYIDDYMVLVGLVLPVHCLTCCVMSCINLV